MKAKVPITNHDAVREVMNVRSINPSTGKVLKRFVSTSKSHVHEAVQKARGAQNAWQKLPLDERYAYFSRLKTIIMDKRRDLSQLMLDETGNMLPDADAEIYEVIDAIDYYYDQAKQTLDRDMPIILNSDAFPDSSARQLLVPYGVIGLIMPWNFPFYSPMMYMLSALMTGNAIVCKPSEYATLVGLRIKQLFDEAGFPDDLIQIIIGDEDVGRVLVSSSVDKIFFVGSVAAGKDIVRSAGIKPLHLEQGGNSAAIVLEDANLDTAVRGITWAGAYHAGQDCVGIKRVFVVEQVADVFLRQLVDAVSQLRPGIDYGPYIREQARNTVKRRLDAAVADGARLMGGGEVGSQAGFWLSPSVLVYTNSRIELVTEETFGNTIPVMIVKDIAEAIAKTNDTSFGLSNAIFSADTAQAEIIGRQLQSGMIFINDPFVALPGWDHWVGWKDSGFGSPESNVMHCLKKRVQTVNHSAQPRDFWFPYSGK